jgi:hypothetical protein
MNDKEKRTVERMIHIYCRNKHATKEELCEACTELNNYAHKRLTYCKFGEHKPACNQCPVHCYKPDMKEKIKEVMRFAGKRMIFHYPIDAVSHLFKKLRKKQIKQ